VLSAEMALPPVACVNCAAPTVIDGLVLAVFVPSVMSVAVTVALPTVLSVTSSDLVPLTRAASAGKSAALSEDVIRTVSVALTGFQFASTALTIALKAVKAVCALGVPVLPVTLPGEALSPGTSNCNFANAPALIVIEGVVLAVIAGCVTSDAVTVAPPAVLNVTLNTLDPLTNAALIGNVAFTSLEVIDTVSLVLIRFQFTSTALTVTLKAVPAVCAVGAPVLPLAVPGAAVSPGARICSFAKAPAVTAINGLVFAVLLPSLTSVAVIVKLPTVLNVTLNVLVPATKKPFAGGVALVSVRVIEVESVMPFTRFQLSSTALMVTLKAVPAI